VFPPVGCVTIIMTGVPVVTTVEVEVVETFLEVEVDVEVKVECEVLILLVDDDVVWRWEVIDVEVLIFSVQGVEVVVVECFGFVVVELFFVEMTLNDVLKNN